MVIHVLGCSQVGQIWWLDHVVRRENYRRSKLLRHLEASHYETG